MPLVPRPRLLAAMAPGLALAAPAHALARPGTVPRCNHLVRGVPAYAAGSAEAHDALAAHYPAGHARLAAADRAGLRRVRADGPRPHGAHGEYRYYRVEGGNYVDGLYDLHADRLRPILPCFRSAFAALEGLRYGHRPPPSATLPRPASGDLANTSSLTP
jgi:hypothetical protein